MLKLCSFVKFIMMNKMCKNHKHLFVTELISALILKPMENLYWVFVEGTRVMQTFELAYTNMLFL